MKSIEIENIRNFTTQLFAGTTFDPYLTAEAVFYTSATFHIDGHLNADFLGEEAMADPENREGLISWKKLKPVCYEIIKGKRVPQQFKIVFKMPETTVSRFLNSSGIVFDPDQISGLFLNVNFKNGKLFCVTGLSLKTFTLDKSLELQWDEYVLKFLQKF